MILHKKTDAYSRTAFFLKESYTFRKIRRILIYIILPGVASFLESIVKPSGQIRKGMTYPLNRYPAVFCIGWEYSSTPNLNKHQAEIGYALEPHLLQWPWYWPSIVDSRSPSNCIFSKAFGGWTFCRIVRVTCSLGRQFSLWPIRIGFPVAWRIHRGWLSFGYGCRDRVRILLWLSCLWLAPFGYEWPHKIDWVFPRSCNWKCLWAAWIFGRKTPQFGRWIWKIRHTSVFCLYLVIRVL